MNKESSNIFPEIFDETVGIIFFLLGVTLIIGGLTMQNWRHLRRARATLPQIREDFVLKQPHLDTLIAAFPDRSPTISALYIRYRVAENSYIHKYEDWHTLDWLSQDVIDAAVFLTSSPYLTHTLSEIDIGFLGNDTLVAYVNHARYPIFTVIFRDEPNLRFPDARAEHHEALGDGYFLRIQAYMIWPVIGQVLIAFGAVGIIIGSFSVRRIVVFMRDRKAMLNSDLK